MTDSRSRSSASAAEPSVRPQRRSIPRATACAPEPLRSSQLQESKMSEPATINGVVKTAKAAVHGTEPGLIKRLAAGAVICAEGYVFELERRGYLQAGAYVPVVLSDHPEVVEPLHMGFVHAGSDVTHA